MNNAALKHEYYETVVSSSNPSTNDNNTESTLQIAMRYQSIAEQAEEACHLSGNICGPELDYFEEEYGISDFA